MDNCYPQFTREPLPEIIIRDEEVLKRVYQIRTTGRLGKSLETTIPREVFDREARRLGLEPDDAVSKLNAVWSYDGFEGLYLSFHIKKPSNDVSHPGDAKKGGGVPV